MEVADPLRRRTLQVARLGRFLQLVKSRHQTSHRFVFIPLLDGGAELEAGTSGEVPGRAARAGGVCEVHVYLPGHRERASVLN